MKIKNIVFAGGGFKGISYLGVYQYLYNNNLINDIQVFCGTSIGSVISLFILLDYTPTELINLFIHLTSHELFNIDINNFLEKFGTDTEEKFISQITDIMSKKINPNITFYEFYNINKKKLMITGSNLTKNKLDIFDYINTPNMKIIDAIKISTAIPFFFTPVIFNKCNETIINKYITQINKNNICEDTCYVDGFIFNNYPIDLFDNEIENTLGLTFMNSINNTNKTDILSYFINILLVYIFKYEKNKVNKYNKNTIVLHIDNSMIFACDISIKEKNELIQLGYNYTRHFFMKRKLYEEQIEIEKNNDIATDILNDILTKVENYFYIKELIK